MDQNFLKAEEICKILAVCRKAGVSVFKCGPLEVTFAGMNPVVEPGGEAAPTPHQNSGAATTPAAEALEETIQAQQRAEHASHEEQEIQTREQQVAELMVTNPLLAEQLMEEGELELAGDPEHGSESDEALHN